MLNLIAVLYIPIQLIWKVRIKMSQKLTLACSLCLTTIVVIFTVTRASGLEWQDKHDVLWMVYFQVVAAEVGLILVSMTAFRALFVSRAARNQHSPHKSPSVWLKSRCFSRNLIDPRRWMSKQSKDMNGGQIDNIMEGGINGDLPRIPGARTARTKNFTSRQGEEAKSEIEFSTYPASAAKTQDTLPSSGQVITPASREQNSLRNQS